MLLELVSLGAPAASVKEERDSTRIKALAMKTSDYTRARERYHPSKVEVLWIAESPPAGGGYYYFEKATGQNPVDLFSETMKALAGGGRGCYYARWNGQTAIFGEVPEQGAFPH